MRGFDVWKILGGKSPRGFKTDVAKEAARKILEAEGLKKAAQKPNMSTGGSELMALAASIGIPSATLYAAYKGTRDKREGK